MAQENRPAGAPGAPPLESFSYDDGIVRLFLLATMGWGLVAFLAGLFIALQLSFPTLNFGIEYHYCPSIRY